MTNAGKVTQFLFYIICFLSTLRLALIGMLFFFDGRYRGTTSSLFFLVASLPQLILIIWMIWDILNRYFVNYRRRTFWLVIIFVFDIFGVVSYFLKYKRHVWDPKQSWGV